MVYEKKEGGNMKEEKLERMKEEMEEGYKGD